MSPWPGQRPGMEEIGNQFGQNLGEDLLRAFVQGRGFRVV